MEKYKKNLPREPQCANSWAYVDLVDGGRSQVDILVVKTIE